MYCAVRDLDLESEVDLVRDLSFPLEGEVDATLRTLLDAPLCLVHRAPQQQQQYPSVSSED